jgi:predicted glycogen debranching enzyme
MISFGREICGNPEFSGQKEWLVTNGLGGYASGTIAGFPTRSYHGLLVAALQPPVGRTLLLTKLDETARYDGCEYPLYACRRATGEIEPRGFQHLERFHLEGTTPVWTFALADALLQKRVWMQPAENTTYIHYTYVRPGTLNGSPRPLDISLLALSNCRDHHAVTQFDGRPLAAAEPVRDGLRILCQADSASPVNSSQAVFYLLSDRASAVPHSEWFMDAFLSIEAERGLRTVEDHYAVARFTVRLLPGESFTITASVHPDPLLDGAAAYRQRQAYESRLLQAAGCSLEPGALPEKTLSERQQLTLAADQFIVARASTVEPEGSSVIAGYPWFGDWGRDTMISLPGLTLAPRRLDTARRILRTFAAFVDQGMLPNRFPDSGEQPGYNTVDATLWYFEALRAYHTAANDDELLRELYPLLQEIITWHRQGTRYNIHVDERDGLVYAGEPGVQLTWMDAKVDDWVVTPRIGKPVEISALWYNALLCMAAFAERLGLPSAEHHQAAQHTRQGFARFWNSSQQCLYDVLDGPAGNDPASRPNQLFAVSLPHSPLSLERQRQVVEVCARKLLTSHGLRSLGPHEPGYAGEYTGDRYERDGAYHQGTVWGWLIGPFISAHLRVYQDAPAARSFLQPLLQHLAAHGIGSMSEIFDGDSPFTPRGCFAQAWTVAETLRVLHQIEDLERKSQ